MGNYPSTIVYVNNVQALARIPLLIGVLYVVQ